jgi:3-deoxy-manno-octulosonate cytidylyltransferase (CMP-KDO synthetase)
VSRTASVIPPLVVIPARYSSSRFPGKPLADLAGKTVLRRCYEQVRKVVPAEQILVATDDDRIAAECRSHDIRYEITSADCLTGTDRVAEVARRNDAEWYVNVQGDEPFLDPRGLKAMLTAIERAPDKCNVLNAYAPITSEEEFRSSTVPKAVVTVGGTLLYISRAAIPTTKALGFRWANRQVGLYAFRADVLQVFSRFGGKTPAEELEDIEILRFLELGYQVQMIEVAGNGIAIDTPEDLERARRLLDGNS